MGSTEDIGSWFIKLDGTGAVLQDEAVEHLNCAVDRLDACLAGLEEQKGIGASFGIDIIADLREKVTRYRNAVKSL